jgi:RNA polymerase sigma-70 factor, ECF subfamily
VPADHELPERLRSVLAVVYSIFTAGHHAAAGPQPVRTDLATEAVRLARLVVELLPGDAEAAGLLALLLAAHARAPARVDASGDIVLLADQDRTRWDRDAITEAAALIDAALRRRQPGPYQVQAAIACLHGLAPSWDDTDWPQILELYELLEALQPTAVVRVNHAVAIAAVRGPEAGLAALDRVDGVDGWHLYWSTKADLLRRLERWDEAAACYRVALDRGANEADRRFLERRLDEVVARSTSRAR